jgi:hypothetical protein
MVGVRISGPEYQTVLWRLEKEGCTNFYIEIVCEFDTDSGAGGNFKTKTEKLGSKKRKFLLSHKKEPFPIYHYYNFCLSQKKEMR